MRLYPVKRFARMTEQNFFCFNFHIHRASNNWELVNKKRMRFKKWVYAKITYFAHRHTYSYVLKMFWTERTQVMIIVGIQLYMLWKCCSNVIASGLNLTVQLRIFSEILLLLYTSIIRAIWHFSVHKNSNLHQNAINAGELKIMANAIKRWINQVK